MLKSFDGKIRTVRRDQISVDERARSQANSQKLSRVLGDNCDSPAAIERWLVHFRSGNLSCADHPRSGQSVIDISECLCGFLGKFPFASANMMFKHFRMARGTIMEILQRELGLKSSPVDGCHINSAHYKKLIVSIFLRLYCTCYNS
jgi:hypothetical protein